MNCPTCSAKSRNADRLDQVSLESLCEQSVAIVRHCEGGERYHGDVPRPCAFAQSSESLIAVHSGQLHVHQDQIGEMAVCEVETLLCVLCLERPVTGEPENIPHKLEVARVVLDDQDQRAGHVTLSAESWAAARLRTVRTRLGPSSPPFAAV